MTADALDPPVRKLVDALVASTPAGPVAFDADGTLWSSDVGEEFLRHLIAADLLPTRRGERALYAEYERRVAGSPQDGFAFAAQVMEGMEEAQLLQLSAAFVARGFTGGTFPFARQLVAELQRAGSQVWVVSASPFWSVVPGAAALGIPAERVIGVRSVVRGGRLTAQVIEPVPTLEGKAGALRALGVRPVLAAGNSVLDVPLLECAEHAVAVIPRGVQNDLHRIAVQRGWAIQYC